MTSVGNSGKRCSPDLLVPCVLPLKRFSKDEQLPTSRLHKDFLQITEEFPLFRKMRKDDFAIFRTMGFFFLERLLSRQNEIGYASEKESLFKKVQEEDLVLVAKSTLAESLHKYLDKGVLLKSFSKHYDHLERATYLRSRKEVNSLLSAEFNSEESSLEPVTTLLFRCLALTAMKNLGQGKQQEPLVIMAVSQLLKDSILFYNNLVELRAGAKSGLQERTAVLFWKDSFAVLYNKQYGDPYMPCSLFHEEKRKIIPVIPLEKSQFQSILMEKSVEDKVSNRSSRSAKEDEPLRPLTPCTPMSKPRNAHDQLSSLVFRTTASKRKANSAHKDQDSQSPKKRESRKNRPEQFKFAKDRVWLDLFSRSNHSSRISDQSAVYNHSEKFGRTYKQQQVGTPQFYHHRDYHSSRDSSHRSRLSGYSNPASISRNPEAYYQSRASSTSKNARLARSQARSRVDSRSARADSRSARGDSRSVRGDSRLAWRVPRMCARRVSPQLYRQRLRQSPRHSPLLNTSPRQMLGRRGFQCRMQGRPLGRAMGYPLRQFKYI